MSAFRIVTVATDGYMQHVAPHFMPSWDKAGACAIDVLPMPSDASRTTGNHDDTALARRVRVICDYLMQHAGERVVCLDLDCFVVRPLGDGFTGKPFGVTRWPDLNMGVVFFDLPAHPVAYWGEFCRQWIAEAVRIASYSVIPDQEALQSVLIRHYEQDVEKLDWRAWNFCCGRSRIVDELPAHTKTVRVVHLKVGKDMASGETIRMLGDIAAIINAGACQ
jgi:hypothetical protein